MNKVRDGEERQGTSVWQRAEALGLSRREFLTQVGRSGAAAMLAACTPLGLVPSSAQAEATPAKPADELLYASAATLAKAIRDKKVSSEEVVTAHLRRIEQVNPKLHAVVQLTAETARAQARTADAALARGEIKGPLHGVPFTVKDLLETAGVICAAGTKGRASFVPTHDATVVARLRGAGAIMLGKTNVPEFGLAVESDNLVYGRTNNPYDLSRTPGGSSGGEAAIIAAGGSPLGLGSDGGGSIRIPAHFCGITGIKPTFGRVPRTGHFPPASPVTHVGPMARFIEDLILTLPIIVGEDQDDPTDETPPPLGDPQKVDLKRLRVAFYTDNGILPATPETVAVVRTVAKALSDAGLTIEEDRPKGIELSFDVYIAPRLADGGMGVSRLLAMVGTAEPSPLVRRFSEALRAYAEKKEPRVQIPNDLESWWDSFMEKYDVILCPVFAYPALPHGTSLDEDKFRAASYSLFYNLTGWPSVTVRAGTSPEGLPIGVQVVARRWREDVALAVAQHIETARGGWRRPPL